MNGIEHLPDWAALVVSLLLIVGASIVLIGALGLLRLRTFYQRIHGPAITVTLGAGCLLLARCCTSRSHNRGPSCMK